LNFGTVARGMVMTQTVWLCNQGEVPVSITAIHAPSAPFTLVGLPGLPASIPGGGSLILNVRFSPTSAGLMSDSMRVESSDPQHPEQVVQLAGYCIPSGESDADQDGVPDSFEFRFAAPVDAMAKGLRTNEYDSHLDYDFDGQNNWKEYMANTDPTASNSVFQLSRTAVQQVGPVLTWYSASNRLYNVSRASSLLTGFAPLSSALPSTPPLNTWTDTAPLSGQGIYRIDVTVP
jgi:hypothetical protein